MLVRCSIIRKIILTYVCSVDHRFPGEEIISSHPCFLILRFQFHCDCHLSILKMCFDFVEEIKFFGSFFVHTCCLGDFGNSSLKDLDIREDQLKVDGLDISERIDASIYVDDVRILKAAYYVNDRIYFTDVCKELVSKSLTFGCALYKTCDINEFNDCRSYFLGVIKISQKFQSLIRYSNNAHIRVDGTERIVC